MWTGFTAISVVSWILSSNDPHFIPTYPLSLSLKWYAGSVLHRDIGLFHGSYLPNDPHSIPANTAIKSSHSLSLMIRELTQSPMRCRLGFSIVTSVVPWTFCASNQHCILNSQPTQQSRSLSLSNDTRTDSLPNDRQTQFLYSHISSSMNLLCPQPAFHSKLKGKGFLSLSLSLANPANSKPNTQLEIYPTNFGSIPEQEPDDCNIAPAASLVLLLLWSSIWNSM